MAFEQSQRRKRLKQPIKKNKTWHYEYKFWDKNIPIADNILINQPTGTTKHWYNKLVEI